MIKTKAEDYGICCTSCQENVNIHGCAECGGRFTDGETIFCVHHSQTDCEHYCEKCKPPTQAPSKDGGV